MTKYIPDSVRTEAARTEAHIIEEDSELKAEAGAIGTASGIAVGALAGAIAGPPGALAGAVIGGVVGALSGVAVGERRQEEIVEELDRDELNLEADQALAERGPVSQESRLQVADSRLDPDLVGAPLSGDPVPLVRRR